MGKKVRRSLHSIIGRREVELLALRVHELLLEAYVGLGTALGCREVEVKINDSRATAAAFILITNGFLVQTDYNGSCRRFKITDAGRKTARRLIR